MFLFLKELQQFLKEFKLKTIFEQNLKCIQRLFSGVVHLGNNLQFFFFEVNETNQNNFIETIVKNTLFTSLISRPANDEHDKKFNATAAAFYSLLLLIKEET